MNKNIEYKIRCLPVYQNQQDFLIGVFSINTILQFTKYTKRLIVGYDDENQPIYNDEIQREVENSRVQKIADFLIEDPNATFPTNLVLHIPSIIIESQKRENNFVEIEFSKKVNDELEKSKMNDESGHVYITIIDGQHRIKGIEIALKRIDHDILLISQTVRGGTHSLNLEKKLSSLIQRKHDLLNIQLVVSFFIDKTLEYQAMVFSTINRTQKRVSDSLVSSLFGLNSDDSPQKTALEIVLALNGHENSPFFNRINLYGSDYSNNQSPPLSQAAMVKSIINLISENLRESERDRFKERKELLKRSIGSMKDLPFRNYYASGKDKCISDIMYFFFNAVKESFIDLTINKSYWDFNPESMKPSNILQTTAGYMALLNLLVDLLKHISEESRYTLNANKNHLVKAKGLNFADVTRYPFTSKSQTIFYLDLILTIFPNPDLNDPRKQKLNELLNK